MISEIFTLLKQNYAKLDPHAETWDLWIRGDKNSAEIYEVAIGTILVQNTNWKNVDKAIVNLKRNHLTFFDHLLRVRIDRLEEIIRPAGFYKQKALYLKSLSKLLLNCVNDDKVPSREELLECKGIGNETADSILVYCFQQPVPIVGAYTRRFLARLNGNGDYLKIGYKKIQQEIESELKPNYKIFGRFHALVVCHAQNVCQKNNPRCQQCFLSSYCIYGQRHQIEPKVAQIQKMITKTTKKYRKTN